MAPNIPSNPPEKTQNYKTPDGSPIIHNVFPRSELQSREWIKIFSTITLLVSVVLMTFLACYTSGVFHHEQFIGQIGPGVSLGLSSFLVLIAGSVLHFSSKKN